MCLPWAAAPHRTAPGAGLSHLAGIQRLESLVLHGCYEVTDAGLAFVCRHVHITSLDLAYLDAITESGT